MIEWGISYRLGGHLKYDKQKPIIKLEYTLR